MSIFSQFFIRLKRVFFPRRLHRKKIQRTGKRRHRATREETLEAGFRRDDLEPEIDGLIEKWWSHAFSNSVIAKAVHAKLPSVSEEYVKGRLRNPDFAGELRAKKSAERRAYRRFRKMQGVSQKSRDAGLLYELTRKEKYRQVFAKEGSP